MSQDTKTQIRRAFEQDIEPARPGLAEEVFAAIPIGIAVAPGFLGWLHQVIAYVVKHWLTASLIGAGAVAAGGYVLATRTPDVALYVAYADHQPQRPGALPNPWQGSPNVIFEGAGSNFDAGAIRLDNRTDGQITVDQIAVDIGPRHYALWGKAIKVPAHGILILTQTRILQVNPFQTDFDTSESKGQTCTPVSPDVPVIHLSVNGHRLSFEDTHLALTTGGHDLGNCPGKPSESHPWEAFGRTG